MRKHVKIIVFVLLFSVVLSVSAFSVSAVDVKLEENIAILENDIMSVAPLETETDYLSQILAYCKYIYNQIYELFEVVELLEYDVYDILQSINNGSAQVGQEFQCFVVFSIGFIAGVMLLKCFSFWKW